MDDPIAQSNAANDPAHAFEALRGEVSLLRRAVEGLTAERQNTPDYEPTLTAIVERLTTIARSPAIQLTPADVDRQLNDASRKARATDRSIIEHDHRELSASVGRINAVVDQAWTAGRQFKNLLWAGAAGCGLGTTLCVGILHLIF